MKLDINILYFNGSIYRVYLFKNISRIRSISIKMYNIKMVMNIV